MARVAIIADVHGNLPALQAVVDAVRGQADHWLCAGDIAGHLPQVDEVVDLLIGLNARCVIGNHDRAFLDGAPIANSSAGTRALQLQRAYVSPNSRKWLASLPERLDLKIDGLSVTIMHGGPASYLGQRVNEVSPEIRAFSDKRLLVLGHTHAPLIEIGADHAIVNPGSVGFPMAGDQRAKAVLFDTRSRSVSRIHVCYDASPVIARMAELGYDERYVNCLQAGRWVGFNGAPPPTAIIVVGAAIYGEVVGELISLRDDMMLVGFVDDRATCGPSGFKILGTVDQLADVAREHEVVDVAVAIGDEQLRRRVTDRIWTCGVRPARLIHPSAVVSPSAQIGPGCIVDAHSYIGPGCRLEQGVSVWPGVVLAHHVHVGAFSSLKHRAAIGGNSTLAAGSKILFGSSWPSGSRIEPTSQREP